MKRSILALTLCFVASYNYAQTSYYKGEWTKKDKSDLFTGILKVEMKKDGRVNGEIVWLYLAADSTDASLLEMYKGKKGRQAIEVVEGRYSPMTNELYWAGEEKIDPDNIISLDIYNLKISADKQVIYGTTDSNGTNSGLFYAIKMNGAAATAFNAAKNKVKVKRK